MASGRNDSCPCGSGKRYKHCCGSLVPVEGSVGSVAASSSHPSYRDTMERALGLQKLGRNDEAAALYEQVLTECPNEPDVLNMLGIIRVAEGRLPEAFSHVRRACEFTGWAVPAMLHNFSYVARVALANADSVRFARQRRRYSSWRDNAKPTPARLSLLCYEATASTAHCLDALAKLDIAPWEIVISDRTADLLPAIRGTIAIRTVPVVGADRHALINQLAAAASGDSLLAFGGTDLAATLALAAAARADTWCFAVAAAPWNALRENLLAESATAGFALLAQARLVASADSLLIPRALHELIAGYRCEAADPLLDYCLRMLWLAEPMPVGYAVSDDGAPGRTLPDNAVSEFEPYLRRALVEESSPNPFSPALCNWGLRFINHVVDHKLFPAVDVIANVADQISIHVERKFLAPISTKPGVNLVGPACGEFGLAENMRAFARASLEGEIPCAIRDINLALNTRQSDDSLSDHFAEEAQHNCSIFFLNPDSRQLYEQSLDAAVFQRPELDFRHVKIGYWFWELEKIPAPWSEAIAKVDEIWVATEFVGEAIRRETTKPVIKIPTPIGFQLKRNYDRRYFDLPDEVFLFLFSFDFHSFAERKNPYGVIRAFRRAFPAHRKDVALVVKSINGTKKLGAVETLLDFADNDPRIMLRDGFMSRDEVFGLQSVADAYVSLHRAEGLGLGLAECMYQGKPVIGTGYSGNLEFMNEGNSALVRYSLVPIKKGEYLYDDPGFFWAEPDEDHAAYLMGKVVDDADYRRMLALQGQKDIHSRFNNKTTATMMRARLKQIGIL